jgi:hypothetical protein
MDLTSTVEEGPGPQNPATTKAVIVPPVKVEATSTVMLGELEPVFKVIPVGNSHT